MKKIVSIPEFVNPYNLIYVNDLLFFELPVISLFKEKNGKLVIYKLVERTEEFEEWFVFKFNKDQMSNFFKFSITLRDLIMFHISNKELYSLKLNNKTLEIMEQKLVEASNFGDKTDAYLGSKDSYYSENGYTDFAKELKALTI